MTSIHFMKDDYQSLPLFKLPNSNSMLERDQADQAGQRKGGVGPLRGLLPSLKGWPPETMRTKYPLSLLLAGSYKSSN